MFDVGAQLPDLKNSPNEIVRWLKNITLLFGETKEGAICTS